MPRYSSDEVFHWKNYEKKTTKEAKTKIPRQKLNLNAPSNNAKLQ